MPLPAPLRVELWLAGAIVMLDQLAKATVSATLELHESVDVIPNFFSLTRVHNYGAAFGLMNAIDFPFKTAILALVAAMALAALAWYGASLPAEQCLARGGLALVVGWRTRPSRWASRS
ncbi:MAG: signal peptidase II [Acidobacteria bacterium]|nr:signal peptidase II [Acidobacteriota bacterium]